MGQLMICSVCDYLEKTAARIPEKTVYVDDSGEISYRQLREKARQTASLLIKHNIFRKPVVIYLDKSVTELQIIWGTIYSGCYYTPIDTHMPLSRVEKILETLEPALVITDELHREALGAMCKEQKIITVEEIEKHATDELAVTARVNGIVDTDLLYVFFTSGSTGTPKGVMISHRAVMDFTENVIKTFQISENDRIGNQAPFYFDLSTLEVYTTVAVGAAMYIIPANYFKFPVKLLQYIAENELNVINWVPSALVLTANLRALKVVDVSCLKKILFCGEVMPCKQLNVWKTYVPGALYVNMYGPTEAACASTYYMVDREFSDGDSLPIGKPFPNTRIHLLKDDGTEARDGEIGEICIAGSSLAYGYYKNDEKTKDSFVTYTEGGYKETIYRTGDLARYNEQGELMYLSRKDFQIKHMGHRIELGEIETALNSLAEIVECCCMYDEEKHKIVVFLVSALEQKAVEEKLALLIPDYMQPNKYCYMKQLPHNANGKIDRAALKKEV